MAKPRLPLSTLPDPALEAELRRLGGSIAFPPTPDLAPRVRDRLDRQALPPTALPMRRAGRWRLWIAAALLLAAIVGALALVPEARTAIANRLGLGGVQIWWVDDLPPTAPDPAGTVLQLGQAMTLAEVQARVAFPAQAPTLPAFSSPAEVYLLGTGDDAMVSFVYPAGPELPSGTVSGVGALLTQFRGATDRPLIEKSLRGGLGTPETTLDFVAIGDQAGFWIANAPHAVFFVCRDGSDCREECYRLAGNVLLWEENGVTFRLESALSRDASLAIAESMAPLE